MIRAGQLRHKITIEKLVQTSDGQGGMNDSFAVHAAGVWAKVTPLSVRETLKNMQTEANASHLVTVRYISGVLHSMRIIFQGRILLIKSIINVDERNEELQILCDEVRQ